MTKFGPVLPFLLRVQTKHFHLVKVLFARGAGCNNSVYCYMHKYFFLCPTIVL